MIELRAPIVDYKFNNVRYLISSLINTPIFASEF